MQAEAARISKKWKITAAYYHREKQKNKNNQNKIKTKQKQQHKQQQSQNGQKLFKEFKNYKQNNNKEYS